MTFIPPTDAIAVYCGSSTGRSPAYAKAASSVGIALARANRPLVYGGGFSGLMGAVSKATLSAGGKAIGIIPRAIVAAGGEGAKTESALTPTTLGEAATLTYETVLVGSMHDRKVEMAKRASGFIGLPGGFGTLEEVYEATTWTMIGIHDKPVVLINVLSYYEPVRQLIKNAIQEGFIMPEFARLVIFVNGPEDHQLHETYDWGEAALKAIDSWRGIGAQAMFDWSNDTPIAETTR